MKKDTIIFVHGAWHGGWCWDKYFRPKFEKHGYAVVTYDLPGHDRPGKIKGINKYGLKDYVKSLEEEVAKLDQLPILIGHSMGGMVIQKFLESNTCKKAVLLTPTPYYGVLPGLHRSLKNPSFFSSLFTRDLYRLVDSEEKCSMAFFSEQLPKEELKEYAGKVCSESFKAFQDLNFPRVKVKHHLEIPMLVIGAENDFLVSEKDNKSTAKKYQADLIMMDNIAHDAMLDVGQERVSDAILDWLERTPV